MLEWSRGQPQIDENFKISIFFGIIDHPLTIFHREGGADSDDEADGDFEKANDSCRLDVNSGHLDGLSSQLQHMARLSGGGVDIIDVEKQGEDDEDEAPLIFTDLQSLCSPHADNEGAVMISLRVWCMDMILYMSSGCAFNL